MSHKLPHTLSLRYERTIERIQAACSSAGRDADEITLVAVSKTFSMERIQELYDLGHRDFGENKVQEFVQKEEALKSAGLCPDIRWHFVGHLQRNKVKIILGRFHLFHGLDSARIADTINQRVRSGQGPIHCLVQVNISEEETKFGVREQDTVQFVRSLVSHENIRIKGLMGMARQSQNATDTRSDFTRLRILRDEIASESDLFVDSGLLSMGMSEDYELAISEGATHVRIGSSIFGSRYVSQ